MRLLSLKTLGVATLVVTTMVLTANFMVYVSNASVSEYKAVCVASEGKPAFNGRHWDCLK